MIAIPIVLNIVEDINKRAVEASMTNIERSAKIFYSNKELTEAFEGITFMCKDGKCISGEEELEVNGKLPENGKINIDSDGLITFDSIVIKGYSCIKEEMFKCEKTSKLKEIVEDAIITINEANPNIDISYKIYGNSIQEVIPTPDNPKEIKSVGDLVTDINDPNYGKYEIPIKVVSKNLFDINDFYNFYLNADGLQKEYLKNNLEIDGYDSISFHAGNGYNNLRQAIIYPIKVEKNTVYTLKYSCRMQEQAEKVSTGIRFSYSDGSTNYVYCPNTTEWSDVILNSDPRKELIGFNFGYNSGGIMYVKKDSAVFYEGKYELNNIPEYEPYNERKYSIYLDEPLRCVGNVCDYMDFGSGKVVRNVKRMILNGEENWGLPTADVTGFSSYRLVMFFPKYPVENFYTSHFGTYPKNVYSLEPITNKATSFLLTDQLIFLVANEIADSINQTSTEQWKNWLKNNNVDIYYELENPIEEKIDLPNIKLNQDISNIIIDTEINPSKLVLEYYR